MSAGPVPPTCYVHHPPTPFISPKLPAATRPFAPEVFSHNGLSFWFQLVSPNYFAAHRHPQSQIAMGYGVRNGEFGWQENGARPEEQQAGGDLVWFLPAGAEHTLRLRRAAFWIVFYLDPTLDVARDVTVHATLGPLGDYVRRDGLIGDLGAALRRERTAERIENPSHVVHLGSLLGSCLLRAHGKETAKGNPVLALPKEIMEHVRSFVIEHLKEPLTLAVLAKAARMGADYFSRRLKYSTGLTAEQFVQQERLNHAQALLRTGEHSVKNVAELCGFQSHAAMTKQFTVRFGRSPRGYLPGDCRL
jgi:AraC-like DNA-binding protein